MKAEQFLFSVGLVDSLSAFAVHRRILHQPCQASERRLKAEELKAEFEPSAAETFSFKALGAFEDFVKRIQLTSAGRFCSAELARDFPI